MEKKNNVFVYAVVFLFVGLIVGNLVSNNHYSKREIAMHNEMMNMDHSMSMNQMMMDMNKSLIGKTGDDFDKAFLSEMIVHHEGAVDMAKLVLETSKKPELIKMANDIITAQTKEINMMKDWQNTWFK